MKCGFFQTFVPVLAISRWPLALLTRFFIVCSLWAAFPLYALGQPEEEAELSRNHSEISELLDEAYRADRDSEIEQLANTALKRSRSINYDVGMMKASILLAEVSIRSGRLEKALRHYLEAEERALATRHEDIGTIYNGMGDLFYSQKLYANAFKYYTLALDRQYYNLPVVEKAADAALMESRYDSAEFYYKILTNRYKEDRNYSRLIQIYQKLAGAYNQSGNLGKTLLYYLRIEDIIEEFGQPFEKGRLYNNLGKVYADLGDYAKALEYFKKTEAECSLAEDKAHPCELQELLYVNMGIALHNNGNTPAGLKYLLRALEPLKARNDKYALANVEHLIATMYFSINDRYNALAHNELAIEYAKAGKQDDILSKAYRTASQVYHDLYDYEKAYDYYIQYLKLSESLQAAERNQQYLLNERSNQLRAAEGEIRFLLAQQEIKERSLRQARIEQEKLEESYSAVTRQRELEAALYHKQQEVDQATLREKVALALQADQKSRLALQALDAEKQKALISQLKQQEAIDEAERVSREQQVELLRRDKTLADLKLSANAEFARNTYIIGGLGAVMLLILAISWWFARRASRRLRLQNQKIEAQKNQIESERSKSDRLLRNILPEEIADELKTRGYAAPKLYDSATVLFTDFVNFTRLSANLPPEEIISELDECFLAFDEIIDRYGLEKIKTIGDAFMCAGGLPVPNDTHAVDAVKAAIEITQWLAERNRTNPKAVFQHMRIGIHTGPVVAGVIGKNKFAYDIWGDAVNLASRLEEQGEAGRINVSQTTYEAVKDHFLCSWRGKKEVHNKGLIDMYFIEKELKTAQK